MDVTHISLILAHIATATNLILLTLTLHGLHCYCTNCVSHWDAIFCPISWGGWLWLLARSIVRPVGKWHAHKCRTIYD